ncbi:DNA primase [Spirosoma taeanense]|uniref:DNA primase n=1 Tax=Spirosoma taeanense TaxID=2735870 RepID=A0A6M5YCS4_9BACT|nr:DNA primase family protein [Spirosoma taeanense]QJW90752.1 DNA primase [Spirosoma taeanense]
MSKAPKNTITVAGLQDAINADAQRLKQNAFVYQTHDQVMQILLLQVLKVDFRELAELPPDNEDAKLKKEHYIVITVEQVLELAQRNQWGLCRRDAFFYAYNGAFWKTIDKDDLKAFLRKAAERMGIDKFKARYVEFSKSLFEQFTETAYLPAPVADRTIVKINLTNGTFDISTESQDLRAPDPADFLTHQLPFAYDPTAKAPLFEQFLNRVQPDLDCQKILAEYIGYLFVSPVKLKLEKTLLLYGSGANGKSVFFEIVTALLGSDNVSHYSLQSLTEEKGYHRANLANKLVNYASEISGKLEANLFKQLVSGEPIEARLPYGQPFILKDYAKLIFNCNELPADVEHTPAYFRRFLIVPFGVTILEAEQDKQLAAKIIQAELSGVFNWVLDGLRRLLAQGRFTDSEAVRGQVEAYKRQSDTVRVFLDEHDYQAHTDYSTPLKELYREYKAFCSEDNYRPVNSRNFKKRLDSYGFHIIRKTGGWVVYVTRTTF